MKSVKIIRTHPFLRIITPVILGVVASRMTDLPIVILCAALAVVYGLAWWTINQSEGTIYTFAVLFLSAMALGKAYQTRHELPYDEPIVVCAQVVDTPQVSGRWQKSTAHVGYYRSGDSTEWHRVAQNIVLNVDTAFRVELGDQISYRGYVNTFERGFYSQPDSAQQQTKQSDYAALMDARGFSGSMYVPAYNVILRAPTSTKNAQYYAKSLQTGAVERLERLRLNEEQRSIVVTMAAGERRGMAKQLKDDYARVGASHLLAVSGLHVGIVMILLNGIFFALPLFRRGHLIKNILVIAAIWGYSILSGLSPSVVRSALMFTGAQVAFATSSHRTSINILLGTAVVMICLNPNNLYDISFQLSFIAVLFILLAYEPIYKRLRTRSTLLNMVISTTVLGVVASVGTMPWVAYKFGNIPLIGMATNPVLILASTIVVLLGVGWIIAPVGFMNGVVSWCLRVAIDVQNAVVEWSAGLRLGAVEVQIPLWTVWISYAILLSLAVWLWTLEDEPKRVKFIEKNDDDF